MKDRLVDIFVVLLILIACISASVTGYIDGQKFGYSQALYEQAHPEAKKLYTVTNKVELELN